MHTAARYLDEAIELGIEELVALSNDDFEHSQELADRRSWLISQAWLVRQGCDDVSYKAKLLQIHKMQTRLTTEADSKRQHIRADIVRSRKESRRMLGYKKAMNFHI